MSSNLDVRKQKIDEVMQSLQRGRDLVRSREEFGVEGIHQFVEDVDGDWLENWTYEPCMTARRRRKERGENLLKVRSYMLLVKNHQLDNPLMAMNLVV
ncbi:hypothetical protein [Anabaena azotica]|uniref:Uncharacterized protein n=1 Tax=Anabaena azotica FACHB-119 TaxID=947527 RepID=A0ABR8DEH0_9NOST|nr:hypothetical protein [Anabaena azotica]MBD2504516.1 hypothetical protein [Anabaena azotica FACHB-119]